MSKTLEEKTRFIELRARGYSYQKISEDINVSKPTLIGWAKDIETSVQINNLRNTFIDELYEKHCLGRNHRIEALGSCLSSVREELSRRDFSEVGTDKLVSLLIKLMGCAKEERDSLYMGSVKAPFSLMGELEITTLKFW